MKNFLYKHWQRVIGGFWAIILINAIVALSGYLDPELISDYYMSYKKDFKN